MPDAAELPGLTEIERDIASFADPYTTVDVVRDGPRIRMAWTARRKERVEFLPVAEGIDGYRGRIAGPEFADLRSVAAAVLKASNRNDAEPFVHTRAARADLDDPPRPAVDVLSELVEDETPAATRVTMLTGDAGAGKTRVLQELVRRHADRYMRGQTKKLLLYVNAQGRALARLNEALALELQDLRVDLTYHSVAVLAKRGILVPVIDGFDELLGVSGYDDAFGPLANLLEQMEGRGQLLAAARSVYYEEEFLSRASSADAPWEEAPVQIQGWNDEDRKACIQGWAAAKGLSETDKESVLTGISRIFRGASKDLASKPYFFFRVAELLLQQPQMDAGGDPLRALVDEYMERELREKLLDRNSRALLTRRQYEKLMRELAEEMWNQDTRELDARSIRYIAEYVAEGEGLSDAAKEIVIKRMPTMAFLSGGGAPAQRNGAFEHEIFFFYFLAQGITSRLADKESNMRLMLSRSPLPEDVAERAATTFHKRRDDCGTDIESILRRLCDVGKSEWIRTTQVRENAGLLTMALLRKLGRIENFSIQSLVFPGGRLSSTSFLKCELIDVTMRRTNLQSARFVGCSARNTLFMEPHVSPDNTHLDIAGLEVDQFVGIRGSDGITLWKPHDIAEILRLCGAPIRDHVDRHTGVQVATTYVALLQRLANAYRRANPICKDDYRLDKMFRDPDWETIERLLVEHELVRKEVRHPSGRAVTFLRRKFAVPDLMWGLGGSYNGDPRIRGFWKALEAASASDTKGH